MRSYYDEIDTDKSGAISVEQLEVPLLSLNLCKDREEVLKIMKVIDLDGNGTIEFDEFLSLIKTAQDKCKVN